ncbi:MAG: DUF1648 domain-containing protein [Flavobacteriaceae bacterium]|nr:DUF1648 domain-containing protein [Flavobacteriaceae bacterium]
MFHKNRPIIKVEKTTFDGLIDWFNIILWVIYFVYVYLQYQHLPDMIPTHFDANGIPDDFGSKNSIWLLPIIAFVILIGMRVLSHYPHQLNYWIKITEVNAPKQYQFGIHILRFATLYVILLFFYISYTTVKIAVNSEINRLGNWFLPVVLGSAMVLLLYILIQMKSIK